MQSFVGSLGADAANISVMDHGRLEENTCGFSGSALLDMGAPGVYRVQLTVKGTYKGDQRLDKNVETTDGKFYIGDWCYAIKHTTEIPHHSEETILICDTGGDGCFSVAVLIS